MPSVLKKDELESYRNTLLGLRARLRGDLDQMTDEALRRAQPESSEGPLTRRVNRPWPGGRAGVASTAGVDWGSPIGGSAIGLGTVVAVMATASDPTTPATRTKRRPGASGSCALPPASQPTCRSCTDPRENAG